MLKGCKFVYDVAVCVCSYVDERIIIKVMDLVERNGWGRNFFPHMAMFMDKHVLK
jgi:hypothetical protein